MERHTPRRAPLPVRTPAPNTVEESLFITMVKVELMADQKIGSDEAEREAYRALQERREKGI